MLTLDELVAAARRLSPRDRLRLIERLAADLEPSLSAEDPAREPAPVDASDDIGQATPGKSLYGILAHLGPGPSEEDIAEMRREAWKNFPREHFLTDDE